MSQRIALFLSIALTAFVLVFIGAALGIGRLAQAAAASPTLDPQRLASLQAREATYQAMIAQANAQLQATDPTATVTASPSPTPEPTAFVYPISPELAAALALQVAPNAYLVKTPVLVDFRGTVAYEVTLSTGLVYVGATNGAILANGAVGNSGSSGAPVRGGGDDEEGD